MRLRLLAVAFTLAACREPAPSRAAALAAAPMTAAAPPVSVAAAAPHPCADCHPDHVAGYAQTGMGRSLYRPQARPPVEDFATAVATHPSGRVTRASVDAEGRWWQSETLPGTAWARRLEAKYVIGSGNHTRSYLGEVNGEVVELPLTWYARRRIWDASPGFDGPAGFRFDRRVAPACLFCHTDLVPHRDGTHAGYRADLPEGISCARCHGDGAAHLASGGDPAQILNPARLPPARQLQVCQQCHLQGVARVLREGRRWDAYDPREPLEAFVSVYVPAGEAGPDFGIASQAHRLSLSACARTGELRCTTCHDPHRPAAAADYGAACRSCHGEGKGCADTHGRAAGADCAGCHMRKGEPSDIPHVEFTDHFIRRRPTAGDGTAPPPSTALVDALAPDARDPDAPVRLGLAHYHAWKHKGLAAHLPEAVRTLTAALAARPDRAEAWAALGRARAAQRDLAGALAAFEEAAKRAPDDPLVLVDAANVRAHAGDLGGAEALLARVVALNPRGVAGWRRLAEVRTRRSAWDEAEAAWAKAWALDPADPTIAAGRGDTALARGRPADAERFFRAAADADPTVPAGAVKLGLLAVERGDRVEAARRLEQAARVAPDHPGVRALRARLGGPP